MSYESVIGLEAHVQLRTATKIFCRCPNQYGGEPNSHICEVCLGYPGTLPVLNREAVDQAIRLSFALDAEVRPYSVFARKNYFYADLPRGYQISQFDRPLAENGRLRLREHDLTIRITRLHMEEDAGKLLHESPGGGMLENESLVDFNRCGTPLLEIVSEPDLRTAEQAADYFQSLHQILVYTGVSDANLEEGNLRIDANVSIRQTGETSLGTRTEIKNLNSFRHVAKAINYEVQRQIAVVESGREVVQSTLTWDAERGQTHLLRTKEEAQDYRYFPEPDLPPLRISTQRLEGLRSALPELPHARRARFQRDYDLPPQDADTLSQTPHLADYFESVVREGSCAGRTVANWIKTEILRAVKERRIDLTRVSLPSTDLIAPARLAKLIAMVEEGVVSASAGKTVLAELWQVNEQPRSVAERLGLIQERDPDQLKAWVIEVLAKHPNQVAQYQSGKTQLLGFFVGKVMGRSRGKADPKQVDQLLADLLADGPTEGPTP